MASAILDNMYNYYLTTYGKSTVSRYDSHKKSELRSVYNNIVKINKESPLYKIKDSADAQKFAIDIKEHARDLKNVIASLSTGDSLAEAFQKKIAVSDQNDIVDADYVGNGDSGENTNSFQMEIKKLASPQLNYGNYLKDDQLAFKPGSYSFDLNTSSASYEFQFNVNPDDTNRSVQDKLAKLFNTASIGIHADVKEDDSGHNAHNEHIQHSGHPGVHARLCDHQTAHIGTQTHVSGQTQRVLAGDAAQNVPRHGQGGHIEGENENVDDVRFIHDQRDRCEDGDDDSQNDRQIAVIGFNCFSGIHLIASSES